MTRDRPIIVLAEPEAFPAAARELLEGVGRVVEAGADRASLLDALRPADALWVRLRHRVDAELLAAAPRLRFVASPTTGLNHVDLAAAARRGVSVLSLRGEVGFLREVRATAEHTLLLVLALLRHLPAAVAHARAGGWDRDRFKGHDLAGRTIGLVGYGRLGTMVARLLLAFEARVLATDPAIDPREVGEGVRLVGLDELLAASDVVSLHASFSEENRGFFGGAAFARMKPGALFVNTARGELVDEAALVAALRSGHLAGAALDVLAGERSEGMANHPLVALSRELPSVLVTPHVGGCTVESMEKTELFLARKLCAALSFT
jgi:D-3-phosphoglycerate dehydrogenase